MIILGEDYGEGASVIQERSYAYAMKSSMWLIDPRPDLPTIVRMVEEGFELSEASRAPVMMELRIRACHVTGEFKTKANRRAAVSGKNRLAGPPRFDYGRLAHPPVIYSQERLKVEERLPAARQFIRARKLNEVIAGDLADVGIIVLGGLTNGVLRALARLDLADLYGASRIPLYVLNVAFPLVPEELREFCAGKRAVLVVEEGSPDYIEQAVNVELRRAGIATRVLGKGMLPTRGRIHLRGAAQRACVVPGRGAARGHRRRRDRGACERDARAQGRGHGGDRRYSGAAAEFLHRLPRTPGIQRHQADAARARADPHQRRHRLPFVRDLRAVQPGQFHPRLRHVARERGRGHPQHGPPPDRGDGRRRVLAQRPDHRGRFEPVQQGRRRADRDEERLRLRHRTAISPFERRQPDRRADRHDHRADLALAGREMAAHGAQLQRRQDDEDPESGHAQRRARPQGDHRRRRMPARAPAPRARRRRRETQARQASCAGALRRRRRDLHRRPFLHQALRLPLAHRQAQSRSAAQRSGGDRDRELRRLRTVRRGRPRRRPVSFVLPRRDHPQSELVGSRAPPRARDDHRRLHGTPRRGARMSAPQPRPITILIAALGGEGGGVLTDWIVSAAAQLDLPVQSTSIPGVAQRTGATTYYIEIVPVPARELGVGDVDIVLASELMEAGRTIAGGFVTPDRTLMIASTARSYLVVEKMAMGDGRYDSARLIKAVKTHAQSHLLLDMDALAKQSGAMINAVMLGLVAGCGRVPIPAAAFERAIRADGKAVDANLTGFRSGLDAATKANAPGAADGAAKDDRAAAGADALAALERAIVMPAAARDVVLAGARRLVAYQDLAYAQLYVDRLAPIRAADARIGVGGRLVKETARHLAVRMSYEDVIRVAQAKIDPTRLPRIAAAMGLKPGIEELCSLLPSRLAERVLAAAERRGLLARLHWGMEVNSASVSGFLRFWLLAKLRRWRPKSYRFQQEQHAIEAWLRLIAEAARLSGDLALEVAECARLIKGYGDTLKRGSAN